MKHRIHTRSLGILLLTSVSLTVIFAFTRPDSVPAALLVVVFILLYGFIMSLLLVVLRLVREAARYQWKDSSLNKVAAGVAIIPTFLLVLQSIGQLTLQDILLTLAFGSIAYFYYHRFFSKTAESDTDRIQ